MQRLKQYIPNREQVQNSRYLKWMGDTLHIADLWHFNRRSVAKAFACGLFWTFIPIPVQTVPAAISALLLRVNLPIAIATVWLTNPITFPPILYLNYRFGCWLLGITHIESFTWSMSWFVHLVENAWLPLFLGSFVTAILASIIGYYLTHLAWRYHIQSKQKSRRGKRQQ